MLRYASSTLSYSKAIGRHPVLSIFSTDHCKEDDNLMIVISYHDNDTITFDVTLCDEVNWNLMTPDVCEQRRFYVSGFTQA